MKTARALLAPDDPKHRRATAAAGLWLLMLAAHIWALSWASHIAAPALPATPTAAPRVVQTRLVRPAPPAHTDMPAAVPWAPPSHQARPTHTTHAATHPATHAATPAAGPASTPSPTAWPSYAATPPPATTRHYLVQRGDQRSPARLVWAPDGSDYRLSFQAEGGALDGLGAASVGQLGLGGLLPQRHVERRRGRDVRATNIDAQAGWVRGSGGGVPHAWVSGGQDSLSWLVQLAAVLQADTTLAQAGARVLLPVASARAGVAVWAFDGLGSEEAIVADGRVVTAVFLRRPAAHPYDLQVEVWLDPADHHWPVRLRLSTPPGPWESLWLWNPTP